MRLNGHIRQRSPRSFELRYSFGADPATGKRKVATSTIRGTRKDAEKELRRLLHAVDTGQHVDPSRVRVTEFVRARIAQWEIAGKKPISAKTAERYRELLENQIVPHIGAKSLQKLRPVDIESWQTTLRASGRKDGKGGISARTIGHAHRVLSKALRDAVRHGLVVENVAAEEGAPEVDEIVIITDDGIKELLTKLAGHPIHIRAIVALFTGVRRANSWRSAGAIPTSAPRSFAFEKPWRRQRPTVFRFKRAKTKNGRRDMTLPDIIVEALRERRRQQLELRMAFGLGKLPDDALVFPALDGGPLSPRTSRATGARRPRSSVWGISHSLPCGIRKRAS
jgi:hypothetical protein